MPANTKRVHLSLKEKAIILEKLKNGGSVTNLARQYGVSKATVSRLQKNSTALLSDVADTFNRGPSNRYEYIFYLNARLVLCDCVNDKQMNICSISDHI